MEYGISRKRVYREVATLATQAKRARMIEAATNEGDDVLISSEHSAKSEPDAYENRDENRVSVTLIFGFKYKDYMFSEKHIPDQLQEDLTGRWSFLI